MATEFWQKWNEEMSHWDTHIEKVKVSDLSNVEKSWVIEGFNRLREAFGDEWLRNAVIDRHPLFWELTNYAPWTRYKLADLGYKLAEARNIKNFPDLKARLVSKTRFYPAEAEFRILMLLRRAGLEVEMVLPTSEKTPDILAKSKGNEIYFEVTAMKEAQDFADANRTFDSLTRPFFGEPDVEFTGKVYKALATPRIERLQLECKEAIKKARAEKTHFEVSKEGIIDYLFYPKGTPRSVVDGWKKSKGLRGGIEGPGVSVDEVKRVKTVVNKKVGQIPRDKAGVIVIFNSNFWGDPERVAPEIITYRVQDEVYEYPNLLGVSIVTSLTSGEQDLVRQEEDFFLVSRTSHGLFRSDILVIPNKHTKFGQLLSVLDVFKKVSLPIPKPV